MDDTQGRDETEDGGPTLGTGLGLGDLEAEDVFGLRRCDVAIDFFGEEFGVAIVGNHGKSLMGARLVRDQY